MYTQPPPGSATFVYSLGGESAPKADVRTQFTKGGSDVISEIHHGNTLVK